MHIRCIRDQVLIRQDPENEKHRSGLYLPQGAHERWNNYGTVLAVGPGNKWPLEVKPGDRVLFKRKPDSALVPDTRLGDPEGWKDLLMLREDDIIGIVESD